MRMTNAERLAKQLETMEDVTALIIRLVNSIPDRFFYLPEIHAEPFRSYQTDIASLVQETRVFKRPSDREMLSSLINRYDEELKELVGEKRHRLAGCLDRLKLAEKKEQILLLATYYHRETYLIETEEKGW